MLPKLPLFRDDRLKEELPEGVVHVWRLRIQDAKSAVDHLRLLLSDEEKERASRFYFEHLEQSFVTARGTLRMILETHTGTPANRIQLRYGEKGKPILATPSRIRFNVSHSGDLAVFALTSDCDIGIDIEKIRSIPDRHEIANRFFCPEEARELALLGATDQERGFFLCWTRKEAYIKAIGDGLSAPLDAFQVTLKPGERAQFVRFRTDPDLVNQWSLNNLDLDPLYAAAIAYRERERKVVVMNALELLSTRQNDQING